MARHQSREVSDRALQSGASLRHDLIDLSIRFLIDDETRDDAGLELLSIGGVWDRSSKEWSDREARSFAEVTLAGDQVPAMEWISSMITHWTGCRISLAREVSIKYRLSGVVIRMSGGWRSLAFLVATGHAAHCEEKYQQTRGVDTHSVQLEQK